MTRPSREPLRPTLRLEGRPKLELSPSLRTGLAVLELPLAALDRWAEACARENPLLEWEPAAGMGLDLSRLPAPETQPWRLTVLEELPALDPADRSLAMALVASLGPDGLLTQPLAPLADRLGVGADHLEDLRRRLARHLKPPGLFARSVVEALTARLEAGPKDRIRELALEALRRGGAEGLSAPALAARLGVGPVVARRVVERLQEVARWTPGAVAEPPRPLYLPPPDLLLTVDPQGQLRVDLGPSPVLRLAPEYGPASPVWSDPEARAYLAPHRRQAAAALKALALRHETLLAVGRALLTPQTAFLKEGPAAIAPLRAAAVAQTLHRHPATIWRTVQEKWVLTPRGLLPLRLFLGRRPPHGKGATLAPAALAARIRALVAAEPPDAPLTDGELAVRLFGEGVSVARRTVAKYRERLGIPGSEGRRRRKMAPNSLDPEVESRLGRTVRREEDRDR